MSTYPDRPPSWPPKFEAADSSQLIGWKEWISKEHKLARASTSHATYSSRRLLEGHMSAQQLRPDKCWEPAASHLKGASRYEWARYAGDTAVGTDPVLGYSSRWAAVAESQRRRQRPAPFAALRQVSMNSLAYTAPRPLTVKPVNRELLASRLWKPPPPSNYSHVIEPDAALSFALILAGATCVWCRDVRDLPIVIAGEPEIHRVMSMAELAPDLPERRSRRPVENSATESSIVSIAFRN